MQVLPYLHLSMDHEDHYLDFYIVLFFFLEKYDIVNQGRFSSPEDVKQNLIRENDTLKLENSRLLEELNRLKAAETEETP